MDTHQLTIKAIHESAVTLIFYTKLGIYGQTYRAGHLTNQHSPKKEGSKMIKFKLDDVIGCIDKDGFIRWATISCHIDSLADCGLKRAALKALKTGGLK